jgi:5,6-dimethylbenzimidazole synthase
MPASNHTISDHSFDTAAREAVYRAIFTCRDVRSHFAPYPVDDAVLARLLLAAHHAPSVGYMQPWNFIVIRDRKRREQVRDLFLAARLEEAGHIASDRQALYRQLRLEGICESPVNLCITCDRRRSGHTPLGRWHNPEMDLYSTSARSRTCGSRRGPKASGSAG